MPGNNTVAGKHIGLLADSETSAYQYNNLFSIFIAQFTPKSAQMLQRWCSDIAVTVCVAGDIRNEAVKRSPVSSH